MKLHIQIPIVLGYAAASLFGRMSPKAKHNAEILGLMVKEPHIPAQALETLYTRGERPWPRVSMA